ncbi:MAG: hypothetical protein GXP35_18365 [Actinobacteria bacterium]|nr:hypothetical protein [Actinomycetota bacterium]
MSFLIVVLLVLLVGGAWALRVRARRSAWVKAADVLGFELEPEVLGGPPKMSGVIDNHTVTVEVDSERVRKAPSIFTHYEISIRTNLPKLRMTRRQKSTLMQGLVGGVDAPIGDAAFDEVIIVDTLDPDALSKRLSAEARLALIELFQLHPISVVSETRVRLATGKQERKADNLIANSRRVGALAQLLITRLDP